MYLANGDCTNSVTWILKVGRLRSNIRLTCPPLPPTRDHARLSSTAQNYVSRASVDEKLRGASTQCATCDIGPWETRDRPTLAGNMLTSRTFVASRQCGRKPRGVRRLSGVRGATTAS